MAIYKRNDKYYIDYYYEGRRLREAVGPNKKMAEKALAKRLTQIAEGKFLEAVQRSSMTFDQLAEQFLDWAKTNKRSWERDERSIRLLGKKFSGMKLAKITPRLIEQYKQERVVYVKGSTVNRELACLKTMFSKAIIWDMASGNPVKKVELFRENNERMRFLDIDEVSRLVDQCSGDLKPIVIAALNTGMRFGEIINLKWNDVDIDNRFIRVPDSKSGRPREIPMNDEMYFTILSLDEHSDYVFCRLDGRKITSVRTAFEKAKHRAGIEDFRFHDLRHTFASHLVMSGVDLLTVMELLGHTTTKMTIRYAHLSPDHRTRAIGKLDYTGSHKSVTNGSREGNALPPNSLSDNRCRSGGIGRRKGLKIPRS